MSCDAFCYCYLASLLLTLIEVTVETGTALYRPLVVWIDIYCSNTNCPLLL